MLRRFRGGDGLLGVLGVGRGDDDSVHVVLPQHVLVVGVDLRRDPLALQEGFGLRRSASATATNFAWGLRSTLCP